MGRRAKNKQGAPEPLFDAETNAHHSKPSAKKLGKRKAEAEDDTLSKRPVKKMKEGGSKKRGAKKGEVVATSNKKGASAESKPQKEDEEDLAEGSGDGWEDVDDEFDVKTEAKWVFTYMTGVLSLITFLQNTVPRQ